MWSHSQQWLSVPFWSEVHCYWSSLDLCGLWLNHNGTETSWYRGTRMRAAGSKLWIQWGLILVGIPAALGCNKPREMYQYSAVRWACFVPVSIYKADVKGLAARVRVWGRKQVVRSGRRRRAGGGDTDHIWPSWLPSICALLASLHPPLSPSYPPVSSTNTHTHTHTQTPASLSTFISFFISSDLQTNLSHVPDSHLFVRLVHQQPRKYN